MEVDGKLRDSKLKTVSVGGLAKPDGKIQHGFRGCIQVRPLCSSSSLVENIEMTDLSAIPASCVVLPRMCTRLCLCLPAGSACGRGSESVSGQEGERGAGLQRARPLRRRPLSRQQLLQRRLGQLLLHLSRRSVCSRVQKMHDRSVTAFNMPACCGIVAITFLSER